MLKTGISGDVKGRVDRASMKGAQAVATMGECRAVLTFRRVARRPSARARLSNRSRADSGPDTTTCCGALSLDRVSSSPTASIRARTAAADAAIGVLGPPVGPTGNEKVFGVFPFGCDICVARHSPPCGIKPGKEGCKTGSQYKPDVPCQYQGTVLGGGTAVTIALVH